jgi:hypothetical protein
MNLAKSIVKQSKALAKNWKNFGPYSENRKTFLNIIASVVLGNSILIIQINVLVFD